MSFEEVDGDLFSVLDTRKKNKIALAHCVSSDLNMGAGIAVIFRKLFGRPILSESLCAPIDIEEGVVYNLITKKKYWEKPTLKSVRLAYSVMMEDMKLRKINELYIPRIGCGLDGLSWKDVKSMILELSKDINVYVYVLRR